MGQSTDQTNIWGLLCSRLWHGIAACGLWATRACAPPLPPLTQFEAMVGSQLRHRLGLSAVAHHRCRCQLQRRRLSSVATVGAAGLGASGVAVLDRGFIRLDGPDALTFLQGLTTNDAMLLEADDTLCQYTSILHPKGELPAA